MKHLKREFDKLTFREVMILVMAWVCLAMSYVILFVGLLTDPEGEVHDSVQTTYGITLFFIASLLGITFHYSVEKSIFKQDILDFLKRKGLTFEDKSDDNPEAELSRESEAQVTGESMPIEKESMINLSK